MFDIIKKNTKPSYNDIPEEMKVNDSDNTNENFEMQKIYVTESPKLGFSSNTLEKQNNSNIHNEDFSKNIELDEISILQKQNKPVLTKKLIPPKQNNRIV